MCNNTNGSFFCSCEMGYQLDSSGLNCSGMLTTQLCLWAFNLAILCVNQANYMFSFGLSGLGLFNTSKFGNCDKKMFYQFAVWPALID